MNSIGLRCFKSKILSFDNVRLIAQKSTKFNENVLYLIKLNKDNKELFGDLIETQKQRRKRSKQEVISVDSDPCALPVKKNAKSKTARKIKTLKAQITNKVETQVETKTGEEVNNCSSIFSKTVKDDEVTDFPLCNEARSNVSFEPPETGIIRFLKNDTCVKFYSAYPSVTKVINDTMSDYAQRLLEKWKEKMIKALGKEKFELMQQDQLNRGSEFHESISRILLGQEPKENTSDDIASSMKSLKHIWPHLNSTTVVESYVAHPQLGYRGVVDCVCKYRGIPVVVEWKLSEKLKPRLQNTYDAPIQLSAYLGALNYDDNIKFQVTHGLVVVAYTSGVPADAFFLKPEVCDHYWKLWLTRLKTYNKLHKNDCLVEEMQPSFDFL